MQINNAWIWFSFVVSPTAYTTHPYPTVTIFSNFVLLFCIRDGVGIQFHFSTRNTISPLMRSTSLSCVKLPHKRALDFHSIWSVSSLNSTFLRSYLRQLLTPNSSSPSSKSSIFFFRNTVAILGSFTVLYKFWEPFVTFHWIFCWCFVWNCTGSEGELVGSVRLLDMDVYVHETWSRSLFIWLFHVFQ